VLENFVEFSGLTGVMETGLWKKRLKVGKYAVWKTLWKVGKTLVKTTFRQLRIGPEK